MKLYVVSFDVANSGLFFPTFSKAMLEIGEWCNPLEDLWVVKSRFGPDQIRDYLLKLFPAFSRLIVVEVASSAHWAGISPACAEWLAKNV